jgi:dolichol-phosphate mannosyltransferase
LNVLATNSNAFISPTNQAEMSKKITLIIPVYNEADNINAFYEATSAVVEELDNYTWELLFVNDGSKDNSWEIIKQLAQRDARVKGICLSRNFGKEIALTAGAESVNDADAVIFIDADLQHPPALIPELLARWEEGFHIVATLRKNIQYSMVRKLGAKLFYHLLNRFSNIDIKPNSTDFRLLDKKVLSVLHTFEERTRFFRGMIDWMGFKKTYVEFSAPDRLEGNSTFNFRNLVNLALAAFTSFSLFPLKIAGYLGVTIIFFTMLLIAYMLFSHCFLGEVYTILAYFVVLNTFLFGVVLAAIGLIALYIGHIHTEVVKRPLYIVQEEVGLIDG